MSSGAAANTVPLSAVIDGELLLSKVTVNRPPDVVPSKLSVVFFSGVTPPRNCRKCRSDPPGLRRSGNAPGDFLGSSHLIGLGEKIAAGW